MLTTHPFDDDKLREECGIFGVSNAEGAAALVAAVEGMAFGAPTITHAVLPTIQASLLLDRCGTPDQKARHHPDLAKLDGRNPVSMLLVEEGGVGPGEWRTTAERVGERWHVDGGKTAVNMNGSDFHLLAARTRNGAIATFLLKGDRPGQDVRNRPAPPTLAGGAGARG